MECFVWLIAFMRNSNKALKNDVSGLWRRTLDIYFSLALNNISMAEIYYILMNYEKESVQWAHSVIPFSSDAHSEIWIVHTLVKSHWQKYSSTSWSAWASSRFITLWRIAIVPLKYETCNAITNPDCWSKLKWDAVSQMELGMNCCYWFWVTRGLFFCSGQETVMKLRHFVNITVSSYRTFHLKT